MRQRLFFFFFCCCCSFFTIMISTAEAEPLGIEKDIFEPFPVEELPPGAQLTLPHPAHMVAPLTMHLEVQANDRAQVLKLSTQAIGGPARPIPLVIYDRQSARTRRITLRTGSSVLYHFKSLQPIRIVPDLSQLPPEQRRQQKILLESNRPLGISYGANPKVLSAF